MDKLKEELERINDMIAYLKEEIKARFPEGYRLRKKLKTLKGRKMGIQWRLENLSEGF